MRGVMSRLRTAPAKPSYASQQTPSTAPVAASKTSAAPKPAASKVSGSAMKGGKAFVSKSDLDTYRKNVGNPNATLGQYMNDLKGKAAVSGGKNDPSVIQKTMKSGQKAFDPTTTTGQYGGPKSSGATPAPKPAETPKPAESPKPFTDKPISGSSAQPVQADKFEKSSAAVPSTTAPKPMMTNFEPAAPMGNIPKMSDQPPSIPSSSSSTPLPPKRPASLKEDVLIGDNKYRII